MSALVAGVPKPLVVWITAFRFLSEICLDGFSMAVSKVASVYRAGGLVLPEPILRF